MTKRAAVYARVCVDDGHSLAEQVAACSEYAQDHDLCVVAKFMDAGRGASGTSVPPLQLERALELARTGGFDVLVVRDAFRLSRRLPDLLRIEGELRDHGVRIEYVLRGDGDTSARSLMKDYARCLTMEQNIRRIRKDQYLLRGRVICGHCGQQMRGHTIYRKGKLNCKRFQYYWCEGHCKRRNARDCDLPPFRADRVDLVVWNWISQSVRESRLEVGSRREVPTCDAGVKRKVLEVLDVRVTLSVEDGQNAVRVRSVLDDTVGSVFQVR